MSQKMSWKRLFLPVFICSLASMFYLYDFVLRVLPSVMSDQLMSQYQISAVGFGFLSSFFFVGYMLMQVPCGLLFDRYGPRRLLTINCLIAAIAAFLFIATDSYLLASIARLLMGVGSAFAYIGALVLAMRWLPDRYYAMAAGVIQLMGAVGAIAGQAALSYWISVSAPFNVMSYVAIFGFILAVMFFMFIRDYPEGMKHQIVKHLKIKIYVRLRHVLRNRQNWYTALYAFLIWAPISIFASLWDVPFLESRDHINATSASLLASGIWIGVAFGGPLFGWLSAYLSSRKIPLMFAATMGVLASSLIIYDPWLPDFIEEILLVLFGVAGSVQAVTFGVVQDNNAPRHGGTAAGLNNMAIVLGGAILQPVVGLLLRWHQSSSVASLPPHYLPGDYKFALSVLPMCFVAAFFVAMFLVRETRCKPQYLVK